MPRTMKFKTELRQMMDIIINSLYSSKDVFLRELISNASDAIDTLRCRLLTERELLPDGPPEWKIRLIPDEQAGTLTVADNGIGMSAKTIAENLGTIARSGTREFLQRLQSSPDQARIELIGQFGVGFYSAFMVAERVTVLTRPAGEEGPGARWESAGQGEYTVEEVEQAEHGTAVVLHLRQGDREFLQPWRIKEIVRRFSDFIEHPIVLVTHDQEGKLQEEVLNRRKAIWLRPQSEVTEAEYHEFYKHLSRDHENPAETIHFAAEGTLEFRAILFLPQRMPFGLMFPDARRGLQLYVRRVFITDDFEKLLPSYLRFVRGVVDSSDLPLNVSREMLQESPLVDRIRRSLTARLLSALATMKKERPEDYLKFFREFGPMLKEGLGGDPSHREKLAELLLFESSRTEPGKMVSLAEYLERGPEGQEAIWYLLGESRRELEHSPYLEVFRQQDREVLLLTDPIDGWAVEALSEYRGKPLKAVDKGELKELGLERKEGEDREQEFQPLLNYLKQRLPGIKAARLSARLTESAACLVVEEDQPGPYLERIIKRMGSQAEAGGERTLELNPDHPVVGGMRRLHATDPADPRLEEYALLLYEQALLAEGSRVEDPAAFARRINRLLARELGQSGAEI